MIARLKPKIKNMRGTGKHAVIRGTAEYLEGSKVRYTWPCGHTEVKDHSKGKITKRMGAAACKFLCRYWGGTGGVNLPLCAKCKRLEAAFDDGPQYPEGSD